MALFLLIMLILSAAGLAALVGVKQWEMQSGHVIFSHARPHFAHRARRIIFWVERVLPALAAHWARRAWRASLTYVHTTIAQGIVAAENFLERALHFVRHKTSAPPKARGEGSAFLREVVEHKKKLLKSTAHKNISNKKVE